MDPRGASASQAQVEAFGRRHRTGLVTLASKPRQLEQARPGTAEANCPGHGSQVSLGRDPVLALGRLLIEFVSTPGRRYALQYSSDLANWKTAVPPVQAAGSRLPWLDDGPPKTDSPPPGLTNRFYRVLLFP